MSISRSRSILINFVLFLQTYEKVATVFKLDEEVVIANVDGENYKDLAQK